ncbi:MAG: protein phosphatase 2C domain-containing protein [Magnetococcus sp. WYHC-3]
MTIPHSLTLVACSDTGRVRDHNEDHVVVDLELGLGLVADGVGGAQAGEVASGLVATLVREELQRLHAGWPREGDAALPSIHRHWVRDMLGRVTGAVAQAARSQPQYQGMCSTLAMVLFHGGGVTVAHVGDSRVYRYRNGWMKQLTSDHTVLQRLLDEGQDPQEARAMVGPHLLFQAMGGDHVVPTVREETVEAGDLFLLCSDGLSDMVDNQQLANTLALCTDLEATARQLVTRANDAGGVDNISVVLAQSREPMPRHRRWWRRWLGR